MPGPNGRRRQALRPAILIEIRAGIAVRELALHQFGDGGTVFGVHGFIGGEFAGCSWLSCLRRVSANQL